MEGEDERDPPKTEPEPLERDPPNAPPEEDGEEERGGGEYDEPLEREPPKLDDGRDEGVGEEYDFEGEEYDRDGDEDREPPKLLRRCARAASATKNVNNSVKQAMKRITAS